MTSFDNEELIKYRLEKAFKTLEEVDILIENQLWATAINRLYYACYYAVTALLLTRNIAAQTHAGVRKMFGLHFIKTGLVNPDYGKFYSDIFDKRQTGDYDDFIVINGEEVKMLVPLAKALIYEIAGIIKS
ncbi:MAG: HEPN domain-containing protein [Bacteroidales bacterium]